jgi:CheY-like chemotaxis protein
MGSPNEVLKMNKQRILVVDDDPDIVDLLTIVLEGEGYQVRSAGGQKEAEQMLMSFNPDLAVLDLVMEEHDSGFILCHEIKALYPGTPVILITHVKAVTGISFQTTSAEQHSWVQADVLMDKPVRAEQVKKEVRRLLAEHAKAEAAP